MQAIAQDRRTNALGCEEIGSAFGLANHGEDRMERAIVQVLG
jgi:hypothetical protein